MRVPSFKRFQRLSALTAFFVCGAIVGAAAFNGLNSEAYNQVLLENFDLKQQIETYQEDIKRLNSDLGKESVIQSIVVFIGVPEDKQSVDVVTEKELKTRLKKDLSGFRGRKIYGIGKDAALARKLLDKKIYTGVGSNDYLVRITTMLVADGVLQVWAEAQVHLRP